MRLMQFFRNSVIGEYAESLCYTLCIAVYTGLRSNQTVLLCRGEFRGEKQNIFDHEPISYKEEVAGGWGD